MQYLEASKELPLKLFGKAKESPAFRGTVIVTVGVVLGSVFAYLLQISLGRMLSVSDYGIFNSLLSLYTIFGVFSTTLSTSLIKMVASLLARNEFGRLTKLFLKLSVYIAIFGVVVFAVTTLFSGEISEYLKIYDRSLVVVFGVFMGISLQNIIPASYLQGLLRFKAYAFWNIFYQFLRFGIPTFFVYLGYRVGSVFMGISAAVVLSFLLSLWLLKKNFTFYSGIDLKPTMRKIVILMGPVVLINIGMTVLNNVDVVMVKHYFNPEEAGHYAGLVTVGKVLIFGAGTVGIVMFPQISRAYEDGKNYFEKFNTFLLMQLFVVASGVLVFVLFPEFITRVMFGEKFLVSAYLLPKYAIFAALYVLINFMIFFFLAIEKMSVFYVMIPAVIGQAVLISMRHRDLAEVININLWVSLLLFAVILIYYGLNVRIYNSTGVQARENY